MLSPADLMGERNVRMNRRRCLAVGGLGLFGLSLPRLLAADRARPDKRPMSCVLFVLQGAPSHIDIWDMKPHQPLEVRGDFKPIQTHVPGMHITEHLPLLAKQAHRFTIVRSMTHQSVFHTSALSQSITGQAPLRDTFNVGLTDNDFPHLGAQLALKCPAERGLPTAVSLPNPVAEAYTIPGQNGGFLGARYDPLCIEGDPNDDRFSVPGLTASFEIGAARLDGREKLLEAVNRGPGRRIPADQMDAHQQRALDLLRSSAARQAFDITREHVGVRERYGRNKHGQSLLLARRLIEAGVRLVTVYWGGRINHPLPYWDTHKQLTSRLKEELLPPFDRCFSAFLEDLHQRGLLESTLVVCLGEFGRTPRFGAKVAGGSDTTGRDHWPHCYSIIVAGGHSGGGRVLGRSDTVGAYPAENPYTPQDLATTLLQSLGVRDPHAEVPDRFGRTVPLTTGRFRPELFGR